MPSKPKIVVSRVKIKFSPLILAVLCGTNTKPKSNASTEFVLRDEKSSLWGCSCVMRDEHDLVLY